MSTDTSREVELYDWAREDAETITVQPAEVGPPVDPPEHPRTWATLDALPEMAPILPAWLRSPAQRRKYARWSVLWVLWHTGYHTAYSYRYAARVLRWAPVGLWRVLRVLARWVADVDGRLTDEPQLRREHPAETLRLLEAHDRAVQRRARGALVVVVLVATAGTVGWWLVPWWARAAAVAAVLVGLARVGRPADRPILDRVQPTGAYRRLTAELVRAALVATGHVKVSKDVTFPREIARAGGGYIATVDLPHGVTASMIADRRDRVASALRLPLDQCWVRPGRHAGQVSLYVADEPLSTRRQPAWPLLRSGKVDIFRPWQLGTDERGDPVSVTLAYANLVCGGVPRMGKTAAVRLLMLAGALDPRVRIIAADLKGTGDFGALTPVCERLFVGDDDDTMADLLSTLRGLRDDMRRRTGVVRTLPRDLCPESKVTSELVDRPGLDLSPTLLVIDESQVLFSDPAQGSEAEEIITDLIRRGPAVGVIAVLSTQRPDAKSLPTAITSNATMRLAFRVMDQNSNDAILGTSAYRNGLRATAFPSSAKGTGWLVGATDEPTVVRTHYVDGPGAERVVARAVAARGGPVPTSRTTERKVRHDLIADLIAVWPDGQDAAWTRELADRLAQLRPDQYRGLDPVTLGAQLRARGVHVGQLHRKVGGRGVTRAGVRRAALPDSRPDSDRPADRSPDSGGIAA
jgi:S-DNA-T family DNA segregation ATPase FtsK/SpoIIIE